jgi:hypothetical protein
MKITAIGLDLAKQVFQVHGVDERGHSVLSRKLRRAQVALFFANLPPCLVGPRPADSIRGRSSKALRQSPDVWPQSDPRPPSSKGRLASRERPCMLPLLGARG